MRRPLATNHACSAKKKLREIIQYRIASVKAPSVVQPLIFNAGVFVLSLWGSELLLKPLHPLVAHLQYFKSAWWITKIPPRNKPITNILSFVLGQQRSRMLATLFKDERCQQLATYGILEKMYLDRIIRGNQLQEFAAMLMPHQKATTADGESKWLVLHSVDITKSALPITMSTGHSWHVWYISPLEAPASLTELWLNTTFCLLANFTTTSLLKN